MAFAFWVAIKNKNLYDNVYDRHKESYVFISFSLFEYIYLNYTFYFILNRMINYTKDHSFKLAETAVQLSQLHQNGGSSHTI